MEPFNELSVGSNLYTRPYLARKTTLLISVKPDHVIWVDFAKFDGSQGTKVKVYLNEYGSKKVKF